LSLERVFVAAIAAAATATLAAAAVATPNASAASIGQCTTHSGTIVAVDFQHWGGPIVRGCGVGQRSDYNLLHTAGFTTAGDQHDGPAFICRLGNSAFHGGRQYPTPAHDDCVLTAPGSAYWSYWLAPAGQNTWSYSQLGAMSEVPKPGEVELWTFGATNVAGTRGSGVPSSSPDALRAHNARPTSETRSQSGSTDAATSVINAKETKDPASSSSAVPLVIGIGLVLLVCGAAGWTTWRRRRYE
jgi:hypothetical protein